MSDFKKLRILTAAAAARAKAYIARKAGHATSTDSGRSRFLPKKLRQIRGADLYALLFILGVLMLSSALHHYIPLGARAAIDPASTEPAIADKRAPGRYSAARLARQPELLLQLSEHDIIQALAEPTLVRVDGPVQVWQYSMQDCVLDLYLTTAQHENRKSGQVTHYESRARQTALFTGPARDDTAKDQQKTGQNEACLPQILQNSRR